MRESVKSSRLKLRSRSGIAYRSTLFLALAVIVTLTSRTRTQTAPETWPAI